MVSKNISIHTDNGCAMVSLYSDDKNWMGATIPVALLYDELYSLVSRLSKETSEEEVSDLLYGNRERDVA